MAEASRGALTVLLGALLLGGCADEAKKREADLTQLLSWLPGGYDNAAQAAHDHEHSRVALIIAKVYTPRLGHHVLFAQESDPDDPRRVMSERMYSFKVDDKRGILESVYTFADPLRWRDGQEHLEMFTGVVVEDVRTVPGCELVWKKDGERFSAATDDKLCHDPAAAHAAGAPASLGSDTLELAGYRFDKQR